MSNVIRSLVVKVGADISDLASGLNDAGKQLKAKTKEMEKSLEGLTYLGKKMTAVGQDLTMGLTLPLAAIGVASTKMAMDAVESENLFEVSMGNMASAARKWSEDISNSLGLNDYAVRKTLATFNVMFDSMGIGQDKALEMSEGLTQLSYDMASFYNLSTDEAFEKLKSGISGEIEPLKSLGLVINETAVKTYAYQNHIAKTGEALTEQQKVLARYGLILDQTSKAQGDLARTMDSPTNQLRIMKEQLTEVSIKIGNALIPVLQALLKAFKPVLDALSNMNPETILFLVSLGMIIAVVGPMLTLLGTLASSVGAVAGMFGVANLTFLETTAIVVAVAAALVLVAAAIAAILGKGAEFNNTVSGLGRSVSQMTTGYSTQHHASGGMIRGNQLGIVNEEGGELQFLKDGTTIVPHDISMEMARNQGTQYIFQPGSVTIDAHNVKDFNSVVDIFNKLPQTAKARG